MTLALSMMMTAALMKISPCVMTMREGFSRNVAFLGPGAVVGWWLGKKLGKKFVWDRGGVGWSRGWMGVIWSEM